MAPLDYDQIEITLCSLHPSEPHAKSTIQSAVNRAELRQKTQDLD